MRRLIINADDLGLTPGVNRGIFHAHQQGVVTSATLMANAGAFQDAVTTAREYTPERPLAIGCHVVLLDGSPVLPANRVRSLLASRNGTLQGEFRNSFSELAVAVCRKHIAPNEVQAEAEAQIRTIQQAGIRLSHLDAHKHAHLFPSVLKPLLRAAKACGIRALRNPFAPVKPLAFAHLARRPHLWTRYSEVRMLRGLASKFRELVDAEGMITTDGTFGIVVTGALDLSLFEAIIGCIPEGTWEFCCHPGYNDPDLARVRTRLRQSRAAELQVLTSPDARAALARHGVQLVSYWDLQ
ncbi:MAG TPA: ChbG/HpnK family deacetylase [Terriglobales bacterium]|nr:ChbG/HpnK family deacetylase [Terriglobales bacterium]